MLDTKKWMGYFFVFLAVHFGSGESAKSQGVSLHPPLHYTIGDAIPNLVFNNLVNYPSLSATLKDFRGKLVIIDFWALWCSPCIDALPKLDSIQRRYSDKIQIVAVDGVGRGDNPKAVREFFSKKGFIIPSVVGDTVLDRIFVHREIPHDVWIDPSGNVIATTGAEEVTVDNIEACLHGDYSTLKLKRDDMSFNPHFPLFFKGNAGRCDSFLFRSLLTRYISSIPSTFRQTPNLRGNEIYLKSVQGTNITILDYYSYVLAMGRRSAIVNPNLMRIHKGDSVFSPWTIRDPGTHWYDTTQLYCYSLDIVNETVDSIFYRNIMLSDLNRVFNCDGKIVKIKMPCLVFRIADPKMLRSKLADSSITQKIKYSDVENSVLDSIGGMPFKYFMRFLSGYYYSAVPLIDETGLGETRVNFSLGLNYQKNKAILKPLNIKEWSEAFAKNGISLSIETKDIEIVDLFIN